ncbi:MAG: amino acid permease [Sphingopyxis sp.]
MTSPADPTERPFGFWTATALIVGGMVGSGIFLLPAALAPFGWTGVLAWVISIIGAISIAYVIARLAQAMPDASGIVAMTAHVLGTLPGALVGWSYWVSTWAAVAAIAIAAASYLSLFVSALSATPLAGSLAATTIIWCLTALNIAGAAVAGRFQVLTTLLKLLPMIAVILTLAIIVPSGQAPLAPMPPANALMTSLFAAVTLTLFPLLGFECAGVVAERVRDPARTIMRATMAGTAFTGLVYILISSGMVLTLPTATLASSTAPFALFIESWVGAGASAWVAAFAAVAAIGALNGWVLIQGEVPLGMARAGLLPAWFARTDKRGVPLRVLLLSSLLASLLVLSNASASLGGVFTFAALLTTCASLWLYAAICVAALMRRIAVPPALIGLLFCAAAMWGAGWRASGLSLLLMLSALPVYWLRQLPKNPPKQAAVA